MGLCKRKKMRMVTVGDEERTLRDWAREARALFNIIVNDDGNLYPNLKLCLDPNRFGRVEFELTSYGGCFLEVIRPRLMCPDDGRMVVAPDPDAYRAFAPFFDNYLLRVHGFKSKNKQVPSFFGDAKDIKAFDPTVKNIISVRMECSRNLEGFPFLPRMSKKQLIDVETKIKVAMEHLNPKYLGDYIVQTDVPLSDGSATQIEGWSIFPVIHRLDQCANFLQHWPTGRGVMYNKKRNFVVYVNQEDHLRLIVRQSNGNLHSAYERLLEGMEIFDKELKYARDKRLGILTVDPERLGNGLRLAVHMHLPQMARHKKVRQKLTQDYGLYEGRPPSQYGEEFVFTHTTSLGCSELDSAKFFQEAIKALLEAEHKLFMASMEDKAIAEVALVTLREFENDIQNLEPLTRILDANQRHRRNKEHHKLAESISAVGGLTLGI